MKYWAFLSYSHTDTKWGDWLHKALETYRVPRRLVGKESRDGKIPERLFPIFRDREELPVSADLGTNINEALEQSRYLIVICSPRSAQSRWVGEEIKTFKKLGREDRILALIVDGEPNASDGKPGFRIEDECFHELMRHRLDSDGAVTPQRTEPIAADAREGKDGKQNAKLKLAAGLLGVNFDDLKQREQERRLRRTRRVLAAAAVLVAGFAVLSVALFFKERQATRAQNEARSRLSDNYFDHALALLGASDHRQGAATLVAALRANPKNSFAADRLLFELDTRDWLVATDFLPLPEDAREPNKTYDETEVVKASISGDGLIEASTLDHMQHPVRVFNWSRSQPGWKTVVDRRKLRKYESPEKATDTSYDFEPNLTPDPTESRRIRSILGHDQDVSGCLLSADRKWAAVNHCGEEEACDCPITIIDLANNRAVTSTKTALAAKAAVTDFKFKGKPDFFQIMTERQQRQKEYPELFGLPAFDLRRSLVWISSCHPGEEFTFGSVLWAIDLRSGRSVFEERFGNFGGQPENTPVDALPRLTPDGNYLFLCHSISNRVGEMVNIFRIRGEDTNLALEAVASNLALPGGLGELTNDGTEIVAIAGSGVAIYRLSVHHSHKGSSHENAQLPDWGYVVQKMELVSPDRSLIARVDMQGHISVLDRATGSNVSAFESEFAPGEGGRFISHAEFSPDSRWLLVWGRSEGGGVRDTEVYDPRSGRLIYPRFEPVLRFSNEGRSVMLRNNQTMPLHLVDGAMPEKFADIAEAIIGAYLDERGVYHVSGSGDSRPIATVKEVRRLIEQVDPSSEWTRFAKDRFASSLVAQ